MTISNPLPPVNILIVDDREENIIALEALVRRDDVNLMTTTSANQALRICWDHDISIALVDVQMPEMDGFELVQILKTNPRTRGMLIIFVTAISKETRYALKGLESGAIDYLYKPLDPNVTIAKVDAFISIVRGQQELKRKNQELEDFQKELVKAKEQAETAKKIKENFLANMSHEIRTPINGIIGLAHLLKSTNLSEDQMKFVDLLEVSSQSLLGVINDILDISKIEAGKFKIVRSSINMRSLVRSIFDLMKFKADEKDVQLILELDDQVPEYVLADSLRLNQILMNLIGNAIKFTEKGAVTLKVTAHKEGKGNVLIKFSVIDTGIGISESGLAKVFNSFEQADDATSQKYGGTGLGLSIVKKLADLKGGNLTVSSVPGQGSIFTFMNSYQLSENKDSAKKSEPGSKLPMFKDVSVLLAEDNMINQFMISKILANWNISVDVVDDGCKVLDKLNENTYDLILMDTYMPTVNGFEATRRIRADFEEPVRSIPIISLSAAVLEEEQQEGWDAGVNDILSKPFDPVALHHKITSLLKKVNKRTFTDQLGRSVTIPFPPQRIVSVVPSQTELLFDLHLDTEVVGITKFCVHPADKFLSKDRVGGTKTLNIPEIRRLRPDLIIANKEENSRDQIEQLMQEFPVWISDIHDLKESLDMICGVGLLVDRESQAEKLISEIKASFSSLQAYTPKFRIAYFIWRDPYMVAGNHTFINSMLTIAGWQNAFQVDRYREVSADEIASGNPDVIFLSSEPYPFKEKHIDEFKLLCPDAEIIMVDGELFSWYGSRLKYTADYLKELQVHVNQRAIDL